MLRICCLAHSCDPDSEHPISRSRAPCFSPDGLPVFSPALNPLLRAPGVLLGLNPSTELVSGVGKPVFQCAPALATTGEKAE